MMPCDEIREQLLDYADGTLATDARGLIARHLAGCPECRREAAAVSAVLDRVLALPDPALPDNFWEQFRATVLRRVAAESPPRESVWTRLRARFGDFSVLRPVPAIGVACALGLMLAIGLMHAPHRRDVVQIEMLAMTDSLPIAQNLDVLERFELLENLDLLEDLPALRSPDFQLRMRRS